MRPIPLLERWVNEYGDRLLGIAYSYVRNRTVAEDCLQDALIKAYRKTSQLENQENPFPWLIRIVINECKGKTRKKQELTLARLPDSPVAGPEDILLKESTLLTVHQAVMMLPEKYRLPIILHYFEELQMDVIAEILGEKPGTIRTRMCRARERLKKILADGDEDEFRVGIESRQIGSSTDWHLR